MAYTEWKVIKVKEMRRKYCNRREGKQLEKIANIIPILRGYNLLLSQ
jgi:hypothetical protein